MFTAMNSDTFDYANDGRLNTWNMKIDQKRETKIQLINISANSNEKRWRNMGKMNGSQ